MKKETLIELNEYAPVLEKHGIACRENSPWLIAGNEADKKWLLFISVRTRQTIPLLETILPVLRDNQITFRVIKNQMLNYQLNSGHWGANDKGKVITLFLTDRKETVATIRILLPMLDGYKGPKVPCTIWINKNLYAAYIRKVGIDPANLVPILTIPTWPLIDAWERKPLLKSEKNIKAQRIGDRYLLVGLLHSCAHSKLFKAMRCDGGINKGWYFIKEIKQDNENRLEWQQQVMNDLQDDLLMPKVVELLKENGHSYLVMEYRKAIPLGNKVISLLNREDKPAAQQIILQHYIQVVQMTAIMHRRGYIHRNISDSGYWLLPDGKIYNIDFERAYSLALQQPGDLLPAEFGYAAPEQGKQSELTVKEDIYSLGALLIFMLTGIQPRNFKENIVHRKIVLEGLIGNKDLAEIACSCLEREPGNRPTLAQLEKAIVVYCPLVMRKNEKGLLTE